MTFSCGAHLPPPSLSLLLNLLLEMSDKITLAYWHIRGVKDQISPSFSLPLLLPLLFSFCPPPLQSTKKKNPTADLHPLSFSLLFSFLPPACPANPLPPCLHQHRVRGQDLQGDLRRQALQPRLLVWREEGPWASFSQCESFRSPSFFLLFFFLFLLLSFCPLWYAPPHSYSLDLFLSTFFFPSLFCLF